MKTEPYTACHQLSTDVTGQIALVKRGGCMFIDKVSLVVKLHRWTIYKINMFLYSPLDHSK